MNKILPILVLLFVSNFSFAGSQTGTVDRIIVRASDGLIYFYLDDPSSRVQPAPCAANPYWIVRDENSNAGKQQYSMILAAHAAGKTVSVTGMNTCIRWRDGEDVNEIKILN
ncbi:hypothetical protein [Vibrio tetraodonis]|uniref:hypothetical protein n=1 Tax=Vibrio tetraodonis TaxID=2231647 RepID=UPI000E0B17EC|nr:hypothetical protein [Vibrio tetraodonis]